MTEEQKDIQTTKEIFNCTETEAKALNLIFRYGGIDGAHHKDWVLNQVVRVITKDKYLDFVAFAKKGEIGKLDGPDEYNYEEGIAP